MKVNNISDLNQEMKPRFEDVGAGDVFEHLRLDNQEKFQQALATYDGDTETLFDLITQYNKARKAHEEVEETWESVIATLTDSQKDNPEKLSSVADFLIRNFSFKTSEMTENIYYYDNPVYVPRGDQRIRQLLQSNLGKHLSTRNINEIIDEVRMRTLEDDQEDEELKKYIPVENGIYNIETGELESGDPGLFLTNKIPVVYDEEANCPAIKEFLHDVVADENVPVLQELIGFCLLREYKFAKAFMLLGGGSNGKSTFLNLLTTFLGEDNLASPSLHELLESKFTRIELKGKLANIHGDLSAQKLYDSGPFKMLTGQDLVRGEIKHKQESYSFHNYAKLIYSANELPETADTSDAFFRRWIIIEFPYKFTSDPNDGYKNKDDDILDDILSEEELSGLFNWAVEGLHRILDNDGFTKTGKIEEIKEKWLTLTDPLQVFVENHCTVDRNTHIKKDDFYEQYQVFCEIHGVDSKPKNQVGKDVPGMRPEIRAARPKVGGKRVNVWDNLQFAEDSPFNPNNDLSPTDGSNRVRGVRGSDDYNAPAHTRVSNPSDKTPDTPDENDGDDTLKDNLSEEDREFLEEEWDESLSYGDLSGTQQEVVKFVEEVGGAKPSEFSHVTKPDNPHTVAEELEEAGFLERQGDEYRVAD